MFQFNTPWKLLVFWCFQGVLKWNIGLKWVKAHKTLLILNILKRIKGLSLDDSDNRRGYVLL